MFIDIYPLEALLTPNIAFKLKMWVNISTERAVYREYIYIYNHNPRAADTREGLLRVYTSEKIRIVSGKKSEEQIFFIWRCKGNRFVQRLSYVLIHILYRIIPQTNLPEFKLSTISLLFDVVLPLISPGSVPVTPAVDIYSFGICALEVWVIF